MKYIVAVHCSLMLTCNHLCRVFDLSGIFERRQPKDCSFCATMRDLGMFTSFLHFPLAFTFYDAGSSSAWGTRLLIFLPL